MLKNYRIIFGTNTFELHMHKGHHIKRKFNILLQLQYKNYI